MNLYLFHVRGFLRPLSQLCGIPNFLSFSLSLSLSRFLFLSLSLFSSPRVTRSNIKISTVRSILVLQPREVAASVRVATFMKGNTSQKVNDVDPALVPFSPQCAHFLHIIFITPAIHLASEINARKMVILDNFMQANAVQANAASLYRIALF